MNAEQAKIKSVATDIMQVNAGNSGVLNAMNNGIQRDWRAGAQKIEVTYKDDQSKHMVYLVQEAKKKPITVNTAAVLMTYGVQSPPGPASVGTEADSIKWAVRELLFKQYKDALKIVTKNLVVLGQTLIVEAEPPIPDLVSTLDAYGTGAANNYGKDILKIRDEGRGPDVKKDFIWPIKVDMKSRH